ncbi:hypothetical protein BgiMline_008782 [Biomphalaria glabrata]
MDSVEASKDLSDKTIDMEWQIDSEWINLSSTPQLPSVGNKRGKQNKHELPHAENSLPVAFHFIPASKGGKYLVIDNQPLRLSQKRDSGYSYWVCSIPCCSARCVLDPEEKKIVRICRSHNHDADISRQEYKKFINALKIAVRENPHVKPKALYDSEIEKAKECWRQSKLKGNSNEEEPNLPTFDKVRTAMYNSRNAVLSSVSLKATEDFSQATPDAALQAGPSRATRSKDGKANPKRKSTPSKTAMQSNLDLDELEEDDDAETDEDWRASTLSSSDQSPMEDINFHFMPSSRGCNILVIDGCLLHQNNVHASGKSYWRCQKRGCFFRAVFDPKVNKVTRTTGLHNHPPDSNEMMRREFMNNLKSQIVENPNISAKVMYDMEVKRVKQELSEFGNTWKIPTFSCVQRQASRLRKSVCSNDEADVEEEMPEEQTLKRQITDIEKKFLEETISAPQEEDSSFSMSLLSPEPAPVQSRNFPDCTFYFIPSKKGKRILVVNDYTFRLNSVKSDERYYWKCTVDPCLFRLVYNENIQDLVKISGKHNHVTNINKLRTREFSFLIKAQMTDDPSLSPKMAYDRVLAKINALENGEQLVRCLPPYSSLRTSLYNLKHKQAVEEELNASSGLQGNQSGGVNNFYLPSHLKGNSESSLGSRSNMESTQDISPKDITCTFSQHLSLEDNDPMEHEDEDKASGTTNMNPMDIAAPSLYDTHDIINQYCEPTTHRGKISVKAVWTQGLQPTSPPDLRKHSDIPDQDYNSQLQMLVKQDEPATENLVITMPDPSTYTLTFVPTSRGGRALVVNGCVLRISYTRDFVTYWRCLNIDCSFRCSYDSQTKKLLRISGEHNHPVNKYSPVIRTFIRRIKKRLCQGSELSPKIIYEEELQRLKGDEKDEELFKRLPSYTSIKSSLYKVKNKSVSQSTSLDEDLDLVSEESEEYREDDSVPDSSDVSSSDELPSDPLLEECFATFNAHLPSWLELEEDKRILDGHLLVRKSVNDASIGWACHKEGCPFRCVIDKETNAITRNQWDHTHKSIIKQIISQAMLSVVKLRAVMDVTILPKTIYEQERRRITDKLSGNKTLFKFIPSLTQVYQLVTKTRMNPSAHRLPKTKLPKESRSKTSGKMNDSSGSSTNSSNSESHFESDYFLDQCENAGGRMSSVTEDQQQQQDHLLYSQCTNDMSIVESTFSPDYQSSYSSSTNSYTNNLNSSASAFQSTAFATMDHGQLFPDPNKTLQYTSGQCYQHQQQLSPQYQKENLLITMSKCEQLPVLDVAAPTQNLLPATQCGTTPSQSLAISPSNENIFTLHGYPLMPAMTQVGTIYWQCHIPGCQFQCVLNANTSQVVQISGNHNHEPPGSHSAFCSQVVKMLQRKSAENLEEPLSNVYWNYMKDLRNVIDSDEILSGLPRFLDVALAMQTARSAMGAAQDPTQFQNVVVGTASSPSKVFEYHFDPTKSSLVVNGASLVLSWRMNDLSFWRCRRTECRFKGILDTELECVHVLNPHTLPCSSSPQEERNASVKRKYPDKPSPRKLKFQRTNETKHKSSH